MIQRIHHVGVVVRDIEPALRHFRDTIGLPYEATEFIENQQVTAAFLKIGNSHIELISPTDPTNGIARYLEKRGEGLHHVCFEVPDVAAELTRLKDDGVEMIDLTPRPGLGGTVGFLHPRALRSVLVELISEDEGVPPPKSVAHDPLGIKRIDHLAFLVGDLKEASELWKSVFGLEVARVLDYSEDRGLLLAQIPVGETTIELLAPSRPDGPIAARLANEGEGMGSTVAVEVRNLDNAVDALRGAGVEVTDPAKGILEGTRVAIASREPGHGVVIQLLERV
jgi:methylmalonyl-CoA/ethylmalonyl-CoA epimerase